MLNPLYIPKTHILKLSSNMNRILFTYFNNGMSCDRLHIIYYLGDWIRKAEIGKSCGTFGGQERCIQGFGWVTWGKENMWKHRHRCETILKWILKKENREAWTGLIWLRIGTGGGCLWMWWTFGFHKMQGISWLAYDQLFPQEGFCTM
jgi:hypothetical protein